MWSIGRKGSVDFLFFYFYFLFLFFFFVDGLVPFGRRRVKEKGSLWRDVSLCVDLIDITIFFGCCFRCVCRLWTE